MGLSGDYNALKLAGPFIILILGKVVFTVSPALFYLLVFGFVFYLVFRKQIAEKNTQLREEKSLKNTESFLKELEEESEKKKNKKQKKQLTAAEKKKLDKKKKEEKKEKELAKKAQKSGNHKGSGDNATTSA